MSLVKRLEREFQSAQIITRRVRPKSPGAANPFVAHDPECDPQIRAKIIECVRALRLKPPRLAAKFKKRVPRSVKIEDRLLSYVDTYNENLAFVKIKGEVQDWIWRRPVIN